AKQLLHDPEAAPREDRALHVFAHLVFLPWVSADTTAGGARRSIARRQVGPEPLLDVEHPLRLLSEGTPSPVMAQRRRRDPQLSTAALDPKADLFQAGRLVGL